MNVERTTDMAVRTPGGRDARFSVRPDAADTPVLLTNIDADEYGLRGRQLTGWAIDVGGYIGAISVALAMDNPGLRVVTVEPVPSNVGLINRNAEQNGVGDRVTVVQASASGPGVETESLAWDYRSVGVEGGSFGPVVDGDYVHATRHMASIFEYPDGEMDAVMHDVPAVSLSGLIERFGMGRVAFLKIDCEGCEWRFLTDPAVALVDYIIGEYHGEPPGRLDDLLGATHEVKRIRVDAVDFGIFEAVLR